MADTTRWSALDHLDSDEEQAAYLDAALDDGDSGLVATVIGDIARARGVTRFAEETGIDVRTIELTFCPEGSPSFDSIAKVARLLGLRLKLVAA